MIRKDYLIEAADAAKEDAGQKANKVKEEIMEVINKAFTEGAIVELKIIEGVDLHNAGKTFSKLRLDIVSNTNFDSFSS